MPSFNQASFIAESVESVLSQSYRNLELIVADGGSTDGTLDWLSQKSRQDARLKWFSGPDTGPANALNKALKTVRGTLIGWLNSDDVYTPDSIQRAANALLAEPTWLMVYGHGEHIDEYGHFIEAYPTRLPSTPVEEFANQCFICQPTVFFKRSMTVLLGPLDETLKTAFDFDYWLRAFVRFPARIGFVDAVQARSRLHAQCITRTLRRCVAEESMRVIARHLGSAPEHWIITYMTEAQRECAPGNSNAALDLEAIAESVYPYMTDSAVTRLQTRLNNRREQ
ncbi:MAG: glycosyltransferase [Methylomicrobium sp.]|nr:glycosyltransferase [Methylomicrobium sp.]